MINMPMALMEEIENMEEQVDNVNQRDGNFKKKSRRNARY